MLIRNALNSATTVLRSDASWNLTLKVHAFYVLSVNGFKISARLTCPWCSFCIFEYERMIGRQILDARTDIGGRSARGWDKGIQVEGFLFPFQKGTGVMCKITATYQFIGLVFDVNHENMACHMDPRPVSRVRHSGKRTNPGFQDKLGIFEAVQAAAEEYGVKIEAENR